MSANLLEGVTPTLANGTTESDGVWHSAGRTVADGHDDLLVWDLAGQTALATNQAYHVGLSTRGAGANSASLHATIGYRDAAGNVNWVNSDPLPIGTSWGRAEATIVIPSGMTPFAFYVAAYGTCPETWMASPTLSCGSPVTLASGAHTPYATQDHVSVTYATKASLKVTDDSVKAEVSARAQTDRNVADLSSRLTQTANSLSSEISDRRSAITTVTGLANAAQSTADAAKSSASNAVSTANSASSSAANAVETANAASSAANAAASDAATAKTNASSAVSTANAAKSTAQTASTNASNAVSTANSANSKSDSAVSTAASASSTANAAKSTVDGMKLGGRNLLKGTSMDVVTGTYPSSAYRDYLAYRTIDVADGDTYTLSFDAKSTHAGDAISCYFYSPNTTLTGVSSTGGSGTGNDGYLQVKLTDSWQRYWCTWTQGATTTSKAVIPFRCYATQGSGTVSMRGVKLEAGNKATDWTPAPEDTDSAVADAKRAGTDAQSSANAAKTMATENRSSIKQLSNSITSEVAQRTKTDQMVSDLSSKLTQTADGFNASIDRLSDTDKKVNSWFGFGADASGNPQLTMGSSSSPVVGVYTNAGLAYKARSGATLLELDGASRSSTMPHVHADDVSIGSWQWTPTQGGTHFTLQWIGG